MSVAHPFPSRHEAEHKHHLGDGSVLQERAS